jgi:hypothetical protein
MNKQESAELFRDMKYLSFVCHHPSLTHSEAMEDWGTARTQTSYFESEVLSQIPFVQLMRRLGRSLPLSPTCAQVYCICVDDLPAGKQLRCERT